MALGAGKLYLDCAFGAGVYSEKLLALMCEEGHVVALINDAVSNNAANKLQSMDVRFDIRHGSLGDLRNVLSEPVAGILLDLGAAFPRMECAGSGCQSDSCSDRHFCESLREWLANTNAAQLAWVFDSYGGFHDAVLADRLAEALLLKQQRDGPYVCTYHFLAALRELLPAFADEHPNLRPAQLCRAICVHLSQEVLQLETALLEGFRLLEFHGRFVIITFRPWELSVIRRFLRAHEEPPFQTQSLMQADRLVELFPLLASNKDFAARRVGRPILPTEEDLKALEASNASGWMMHVLEKVPFTCSWTLRQMKSLGESSADAVPAGVGQREPLYEAAGLTSDVCDTGAKCCKEHDTKEKADLLLQLRNDILLRKKQLKEQGVGSQQQKKDPMLVELIKKLNFMHRNGDTYIEKVQERCRNRVHIPVMLEEAVENLLLPGPNGLYVDCTFGRGGHSKLILSKLSARGRLKAFDIDPLAVQVGQKLAAIDARFEILHRPFGDVASAVDGQLSGVLLDPGVSSPQLDDASRGFSVKVKKDGPLDLRMNQEIGIPASEWLQTVNAVELARVIQKTCYRLENPLPERIAEVILQRQRELGQYQTTQQLVSVLDEFNAQIQEEHPNLRLAHFVLCAIRIFLNREMEQLEQVLEGAFQRLQFFGRCVIICFNRWEVASVRCFLRDHEEPSSWVPSSGISQHRLTELFPLVHSGKDFAVRLAAKPVRPQPEEIYRNQRSKSKLFVLEKVPRCSSTSTVRDWCSAVQESSESGKYGVCAAKSRLQEPPAPVQSRVQGHLMGRAPVAENS